MRRELVHPAWNLITELHLELSERLKEVHAPRVLARRVEDANHSAAVDVFVAARSGSYSYLRRAKERVACCEELLERLHDERFLSPHFLLWTRLQIDRIFIELDHFDPQKREPELPRPPRRRLTRPADT